MTTAPAFTRESNVSSCSTPRRPWLVLSRARPWALSFLALLFCAIQPNAARAWDGPFHYVWTYYLSLQVGFNERQAYQIASGTYSFDWDPDTDPLSAGGIMDVLEGTDRWRFVDPHVHEVWRESLPEVERRMAQFLAGESGRGPDWVLGQEWGRYFSALSERSRPARNWVKYHAFAPAEFTVSLKTIRDTALPLPVLLSGITKVRFAWEAACGETPEEQCVEAYENLKPSTHPMIRGRYKAFQSVRDDFERRSKMTYEEAVAQVVKMRAEWKTRGKWAFWDQLLTWGGVAGVNVDAPEIERVREKYSNELWQLALRERNPGPFLHFTQDRVPHGPWDNTRGHALVGHLPDFISSNPEGAWQSTQDTLAGLCKFRALLNKNTYAPPPAATSKPRFLWQPQVGPGLCEYLEDQASERTGGDTMTDPSARLVNIRKALARLGEVNPLPRSPALVAFASDKLDEMTYDHWEPDDYWLGLPSISAALSAVNKQIAADYKQGLLPADKNLSLNTTWKTEIQSDSITEFQQQKTYTLPNELIAYDFDNCARVVSASASLPCDSQGLQKQNGALDNADQGYPVETITVSMGAPDVSAIKETGPSGGERVRFDIKLFYELLGLKEIFAKPNEVPAYGTVETLWTLVPRDRFYDERKRLFENARSTYSRSPAQEDARNAQLDRMSAPELNKATFSVMHLQKGFKFGPTDLPVMEACDVVRLRREPQAANGGPPTDDERAVLGAALLKKLGETVSSRSDSRGPRYPAQTLVAGEDRANFFHIRSVSADGEYATTISVFADWNWVTDDSGGEILGVCAVHVNGVAPSVISFPMEAPEEKAPDTDVQISDFQPGKRPASPRP